MRARPPLTRARGVPAGRRSAGDGPTGARPPAPARGRATDAAGPAAVDDRGSTLLEVLAALTLLAVAAAVVAAAATASLRAAREAAATGRLLGLAARELSILQSRGAPELSASDTFAEPGLRGEVARAAEVRHAGGLATLAVTVAAGDPPRSVTLATAMLAPD
jgi:prepilin-type N-terminal cleavage/methylation domain-containing protein